VPQAWTVSLEVSFYLLAPFVLRSNTVTLACLMLCTFLMRVFAFKGGFAHDPWTYRFFPFELGYFLLGALAFRASTFGPVRACLNGFPRLAPILAFLMAISVLIGWGRMSSIGAISRATTYIGQPVGLFVLTAISLPLLLRFSAQNRWDRRLGDLSYPVYIVHYSVIWVLGVWPVAPELGTWRNLAITLILSAGIAFVVEGPVDRWRQRRVQRPAVKKDTVTLTEGIHQ
jgi:peptidoglycan/LPS O-acetylase OafA/YrhL